jgi:hypothetical protein
MTKWLKLEEDDPSGVLSDIEVWGIKKLKYTMKDLEKWYDKQCLSGSDSESEKSAPSHKKNKGKSTNSKKMK